MFKPMGNGRVFRATLPEERVDWLRNELIGWAIKCSAGPMFITRKICIAMISLAFRIAPDRWPQFMSSTVNALAQSNMANTNAINDTILEFLTLVPQEVDNAELLGGQKMQMMQQCKSETPMVLSLLSTYIQQPPCYERSLKCLASWIQYGIEIEPAFPLLEKTMQLLVTDDDLLELAADVLIEGLQQSSWNRYQSFRDVLLECLTNDNIINKCKVACIEEEDESAARVLAKLLTAYAETYADDIALQLANPKIGSLMHMILQLTGFPGYYPVDQTVSEIPLNFWYVLQETLFDHGLIPVRDAATASSTAIPDGDDDIALGDASLAAPHAQDALWKQRCGETATGLYRQLVLIIEQKSVYPEDSVWLTWTRDCKDRFRNCRRDMGDTMINAYYVLGGDMLSMVIDHVFLHLQQGPHASMEAALFCIKMVSEELRADEDVHIKRLFDSNLLTELAQNPSLRLRNTALSLLGSLSDWFKKHPQFLVPVMNFIVPCLGEPTLSMTAATSFSTICDACRSSLIENLGSLMHVYGTTTASTIEPAAMQKVVESVAAVIQVLPMDRALGPLMTLADSILQALHSGAQAAEQDVDAQRAVVQVQLGNLTACCKGIQSPDDDYQSIGERNQLFDRFASGELTTLYRLVPGVQETTHALLQAIQHIMATWSRDEDVMRQLTRFLEAAIRSTSPVLALSFTDLVHLIDSGYQIGGFACWLHTTAHVITVYGGYPPHLADLSQLVQSLSARTFQMIASAQDMEQHPDVVYSYFNLLDRITQRCPRLFCELPTQGWSTMLNFAIASMGVQERLALQAALNFMAGFVSQDPSDPMVRELVSNMISNMGLQMMEKLLMGIGGGVPRSFSKPLIDVLYKVTTHYLQQCRHWLQVLLAQDGFPTPLVTAQDKETFIKGILGHRSLKQFKEYTNDFSKKCRGLGATTFG
ncbi:armadillo-type protein [Gongronella butleri]|nr:armadillo-type protein [Gongronella butleri]